MRQAKLLRPDLRVIMATGYVSRAKDAASLGKLLFKPLRADQIEAEIRAILNEARIGAIDWPVNYDARDPELLAWLASLTPEEQYVTRCALLRLIKSFQNDWDFKADTETLRTRLKPDGAELSRLWKRARERSEAIEKTLAQRG